MADGDLALISDLAEIVGFFSNLKKMSLILGIETSCDETAVAVLKNRKILSNLVISQIAVHKKYQGIVPELACRKHLENINSLLYLALKEAKINFSQLSAVAVTNGPGLVGALLIGVMAAKAVAYVHHLPLIPINHLEGHIFANFLNTQIAQKKNADYAEIKPPFLGLIISGGHTDLLLVKDFGKYQVLGRTRDDAVGEAYDKVAKLLNLGYPGGPLIDNLAKKGNPEAINFPRPYLWGSWDFSFSGLKTAVVNYVKSHQLHPAPNLVRGKSAISHQQEDIVASFQQAVVETLVKKTLKAAEKFKMKKIVLGGGVAANSALRIAFDEEKKKGWRIYYPEPGLCTDNAAMIACAGYYKMQNAKCKMQKLGIKVDPNLPLTNWNEKNSC
jgi:N6-L-threonylcarbamoyladenine synthase